MPVYEFKCKKCAKKFEKILKISQRHEEITCPSCDGEGFQVLALPAPPVFRGKGFYVTDYKDKS